jgi:hypothetical protein
MTRTKLSPLAQELFDKLNAHSHLFSVESASLMLSEDASISHAHRSAYKEIYEFCQNDY